MARKPSLTPKLARRLTEIQREAQEAGCKSAGQIQGYVVVYLLEENDRLAPRQPHAEETH